MRLIVDGAICTGQGQCAAAAPTIYQLDDDGFQIPRDVPIEVPTGEEQAGELGRLSCPESAISVVD